MDVCKQLQAYEVEYHVLQDELLDTPPTLNQHQRAAQLERTNQSLRQQNLDLLEELQVSYIHARLRVKLSYTLIIVTFTHFLPPTHPGVPCSRVQPGGSIGDFGPVRGSAEAAGLFSGRGEEAAVEHRHTPQGPPCQPGHTNNPRRTQSPPAL